MTTGGNGGARPQPPREPEAAECCQSGCDPCVYDHYWEAYAKYEQALADWELRQRENSSPD